MLFFNFNMPFVVLRIKSDTQTIKEWYGCMVSEQSTFIDTFRDFSSGDIDKGVPISQEYWCSSVKASKTKTLSSDSLEIQADLLVKDVIGAHGIFIAFLPRKGSF